MALPGRGLKASSGVWASSLCNCRAACGYMAELASCCFRRCGAPQGGVLGRRAAARCSRVRAAILVALAALHPRMLVQCNALHIGCA
eukprot:5712664-Alexandrium_andersonii.AAC.1